MRPENNILSELNEISPLLAAMPKVNVFSVPEGYFASIGPTVLLCINNDPLLHDGSVPEGYFDGLADNILQKIRRINNEENESLPAVISGLNKRNVYEVPDNYFETLPKNILAGINRPEAKIASISLYRSLIKYAAAAVLTGALALGVYKFIDKTNRNTNTNPVMVASLDPTIEKGKNMDEKQFNLTLNNLSEEDIAAYLEKNGDEQDIQTLVSVIDEKNLPDQDEYLLNAKTLDNYLPDTASNNENK